MRKIKIFIASPGELQDERDRVSMIVDDLAQTISIGRSEKIELETVRWETHTWPDMGEDAQDVINSQIKDFDIFVGVMWKKFGTPTKRSQSGTVEEFERALANHRDNGRPKIMFYFKELPFYVQNLKEWSQFRKVLLFRQNLSKLGCLFQTYTEPLDFERAFRKQLTQQILGICGREGKYIPPSDELLRERLSTIATLQGIEDEMVEAIRAHLPEDVVVSITKEIFPERNIDNILDNVRSRTRRRS